MRALSALLVLLSIAGCSSERPNFDPPNNTGGSGGAAGGDGDGDGDGEDDGDGDTGGTMGDGDSGGSPGDGDGDGDTGGSPVDGDGDGDGDTGGSGGSMSCEGVEVDGACVLPCDTDGQVRCDGECIDPATDADFCGATEACQNAGAACERDEACVLGACRSWGKAASVGPFLDAYALGTVALVIDDAGNATLSHNVSMGGTLIAKRRAAGGSWSGAHTLDDHVSGDTSRPKLAVDGDGNVLAVWASNGLGHGWARYRAKAGSWGSSAALDLGTPTSGPFFASPVSMASAPSGDVYIGFDNVNFSAGTEAWTRRFGFEADGWFNPVRHDENGTEEAWFGALVVDADSNVTATWTERVNDTELVRRASHWSAADNQWSASKELGDGLSAFHGAADAEGNVAFVSCSSAIIVPHNYDRAEDSWATDPALVDDPDASIGGCVIASNSTGEMMLAWSQDTPDGRKNRVSRRNPITGTWQGATNIMDIPDGSSSPAIGMDAAGNAWAIAHLYEDDNTEIIARRYNAELQMWEDELTIVSATAPATVNQPRLAVSPSGSAVVVWAYQEDSSESSALSARAYE